MKYYFFEEVSLTLINFALRSIGERSARDTFPLETRTLTITHRRPLKKWGDTLIITIYGDRTDSEVEMTVETKNFPVEDILADRVIWYFLGLDGLENVKSIELNETSEVII